VVSQLKVNEIIKQSGSSITIGETGDTVSGPFTNVPAFYAKVGSNQTISDNTQTKIAFDTEVFDTNSAYNTSDYRFTVPTGFAGKYMINGAYAFSNYGGAAGDRIQLIIRRNGSDNNDGFIGDYAPSTAGSADPGIEINRVLSLAVGDYLEMYVYQTTGASATLMSAYSSFAGYRIIGA
tara:strand:+ start:194 stop:730 length:537 start_codon:yes stop_codon:yes gene_type:complete